MWACNLELRFLDFSNCGRVTCEGVSRGRAPAGRATRARGCWAREGAAPAPYARQPGGDAGLHAAPPRGVDAEPRGSVWWRKLRTDVRSARRVAAREPSLGKSLLARGKRPSLRPPPVPHEAARQPLDSQAQSGALPDCRAQCLAARAIRQHRGAGRGAGRAGQVARCLIRGAVRPSHAQAPEPSSSPSRPPCPQASRLEPCPDRGCKCVFFFFFPTPRGGPAVARAVTAVACARASSERRARGRGVRGSGRWPVVASGGQCRVVSLCGILHV